MAISFPFKFIVNKGTISFCFFQLEEPNFLDFIFPGQYITEKGMELFEQAKQDFEWFECRLENCIQPTLVKPSSMSPRREEFWKDYKKMEFASFLKKYTKPLTMPLRLKRNVKNVMYHIGIRKHP